jgi:RNase P/RNase MRP subunit p30
VSFIFYFMKQIILTEKNFSRLKELVKKNKDKEIIFSSEDDELNRKVMEKLEISGVLISLKERKDYMKQRNSGFNQVMAKIAKNKNIFICFDFEELINSQEKSRILARLKQNIFLCNKYDVVLKFVGIEKIDIKGLKSLMLVLGLKTSLVKEL